MSENGQPTNHQGKPARVVPNEPENALRWDPIRHFVAVARAGSVVGASRAVGVSHATVIRNIERLEAQLGVRLFDHVRSGYRITADGEEVLASALAMEQHAEALQRRAMGKNPNPQGLLKMVVADATLFDPMPLLRRFREAQPRIDLALEAGQGEAEQRLTQLHADVAVMVTRAPPENLVGRQLMPLRLAYFAAAGVVPATPDDADWVLWTLAGAGGIDEAWQRAALRRLSGRPRVVLQADKHADALAAARAGVGVSLLRDTPHAGLVRLPFAAPDETFGVWLLAHPDLRRAGRVRALFEFVAADLHAAVDVP